MSTILPVIEKALFNGSLTEIYIETKIKKQKHISHLRRLYNNKNKNGTYNNQLQRLQNVDNL